MKKSAIAAGAMALLLAGGTLLLAQAGDAKKGKAAFEENCGVCHNVDSTEKIVGPGLKGLFKHDKLNNGKKPTEANVREVINDGGNGMPAFMDILSDDERNNVIAYLKTL